MSILKNEKVVIKPVEEYVAGWIPEGKDGRIRWEGTEYEYDAPMTSYGIARVLTTEEEDFLEKAINKTRPTGWLNPYAKIPGVWIGKNRFKLIIPAEGITLDLSNPIDYILYKIALTIKEDIAPSYDERLDKKYLFYMEKVSTIEKNKVEKVDKMMKANELFGKIKDNRAKMRNFWLVANRGDTGRVPLDIREVELKTKVYEFLQDRTDMFLNIIEDPDYKYKVLYYRGLETGALEKTGYEIRASYSNGKVIGNSMTDVIEYIKTLEEDKTRQEEFAIFKNRINK